MWRLYRRRQQCLFTDDAAPTEESDKKTFIPDNQANKQHLNMNESQIRTSAAVKQHGAPDRQVCADSIDVPLLKAQRMHLQALLRLECNLIMLASPTSDGGAICSIKVSTSGHSGKMEEALHTGVGHMLSTCTHAQFSCEPQMSGKGRRHVTMETSRNLLQKSFGLQGEIKHGPIRRRILSAQEQKLSANLETQIHSNPFTIIFLVVSEKANWPMSSLFLMSRAMFLRAVATAQTTRSLSILSNSTRIGRPFSLRTAARI